MDGVDVVREGDGDRSGLTFMHHYEISNTSRSFVNLVNTPLFLHPRFT